MNCRQVNDLCTDYAAGTLPTESKLDWEAHLAGCAKCREEAAGLPEVWRMLAQLPVLEPSAELDVRFHATLAGYRQEMQPAQKIRSWQQALSNWIAQLWPAQPAFRFGMAVALLGAGLLIGKMGGRKQNEDVAELRSELVALKAQVALSLLEQQSASERLRGVEWTIRLQQPQEEIVSALLHTLEADSNANVRLAAVEALQRFAGQEKVRKVMLHSLPREESPLVQIGLIDLMVEQNDQAIVPLLKALLEKVETNESVRQRAELGLRQLS